MHELYVSLAGRRGAVVVHQDEGLNVGQLAHGDNGVVCASGQGEVGIDGHRLSGTGRGNLHIVGSEVKGGIVGNAFEGGAAKGNGTVHPY
jgi:hypothetical protein